MTSRTQLFDLFRPWLDEQGYTGARIASVDAFCDLIGLGREIVVIAPVTAPAGRKINKAGLDLIKEFEGLRLKAYPDPATNGDPWTIGVGHTGPEVKPGLVITEARADALLKSDVARFERAVDGFTKGYATDNQFAAMVSLAFNVGESAIGGSTLMRKHIARDHVGAANEFVRWNRAGGKIMAGLTRRRLAETSLYRKT